MRLTLCSRFQSNRAAVATVLLCGLTGILAAWPAVGADVFVNKQGNDGNTGGGRDKAFLTVQKGLDALKPGDTLTIGPGEYFENAARTNLGNAQVDTIIRSEIPGAAVLRGDVPAPEFKKVDGYRFVYAAPFDRTPQGVLEHQTWRTLLSKANVAELEFDPGFFHYDTNSRTLYISNPDLSPPDQHRYSIAVSGQNGLQLTKPQRVIIEGLSATGFYPGWGINLDAPSSCTVRGCVLFLCVGGLRFGPGEQGGLAGSNNVIENCVSYGHVFGGIVRYGADHDVIRNCRTFRSKHEGQEYFGIMHYTYMTGPLMISNNLAWGQSFDYSVKPGHQQETVANNVGLGYIRNANMVHNLIGGGNEYDRDASTTPADNILFVREPKLDRDFEFADPLNMDYRLQPDSRFRKTAPDGRDRGPYQYAANIFYLAPAGNDEADGLSMRQPWRTLERAFKVLRPGDTLYLAEGEYAAAAWTRAGNGKTPIRIGGRGRGTVVIKGKLILARGAGIAFERLNFPDGVELLDGRDLAFMNCTFPGAMNALNACKVKSVKVTHSLFTGAPLNLKDTEGVTLSGNIYAGAGQPAVRVDSADAVLYSDYNSYPSMTPCWEVGRKAWSFADLQLRHDRYSRILTPEFALERGVPRLKAEQRFKGLGPHSTALGWHHDYEITTEGIDLVGPLLHSANDTTANVEWWSSHPANYTVAWGETPDMTNGTRSLRGPERFNTFSLMGLKPGHKYYFAIRSAEAVVGDGAQRLPVLRPTDARVAFTTATTASGPKAYYVAPDGNDANSGLGRQQALRTVNRAAALVGPGDTVLVGGGDYGETIRVRAAGTKERPITFRAIPGERAVFKGEGLSLAFQVIMKPDNRFDGFYFYYGFWDPVFVVRQSARVQITRCLNAGINADESPGIVVRNCVARGGWSAVSLSRSPDSLVENNVFIMTILRQLVCDAPTVARNNIFCECIRNKTHQTLLQLSGKVAESNNCFYLRWPEDEKLAINDRPLTEYRARTGSDVFAANPMMPGTPGWLQGWQHSSDKNFDEFFSANPRLVLRGIGLQPEAFRGLPLGVTNWVYDRVWAAAVVRGTNAAARLAQEGRYGEALAAYTNLVIGMPLCDRLKSDVLAQASLCAGKLKDHVLALQLAKRMPVEPLAIQRQMQLMLEQEQYAALLGAFTPDKMGGRNFHQSLTYPELEDVMADLYYYRSIAYAHTNNLVAAEADLKVMNEKRMQLTYRSGESIHDLTWLRLGNFYRDQLKDDDRALAAYTNVTDRTTWTYWGRPRKPAARGADATLVAATKAASEILRKRGREADALQLQFSLLQAQAEAAASVLKTDEMLNRFTEAMAIPGRFSAAMRASTMHIGGLSGEAREKVVKGLGALAAGLSDDTRSVLVNVATEPEAGKRDIGVRALLMFAPPDKVTDLLAQTAKAGPSR
jgi:hypothetical protein